MDTNFDKNFEKQVEETILSAILVCDTVEDHNNEKDEGEKTVREIIQGHNLIPTDFQYEHHQHLFKAIMQAWADNVSVNTVSIASYKPQAFYRHNNDWDMLNVEIAEKHISIANLNQSLWKFKEHRLARFWHTTASRILQTDWASQDVVDASDSIKNRFDSLFTRLTKDRRKVDTDYISELTDKYINVQAGVTPFIPTGNDTLNNMLNGGFVNGELIILAGRPGMLKTTIALIMAWEAHKRGYAVIFYSIEMPKYQIKSKIISKETGIDYNRIKKGEISSEELAIITAFNKKIDDSNFEIVDHIKRTDDIYRHTQDMKKEGKCDVVFIDYLQLCKTSIKEVRLSTTYTTRELKSLAKECYVPVVALSQLSRKVEDRDNKRPYLNDLKESSSIEEDADIVLFPYRDAYYSLKFNSMASIPANEMWKVEINVGKGRDIGIKGIVLDISPITMEINDYPHNLV